MESNDLLESKIFKGIVLLFCGLIILVFVFGLGVFVGAKRADFSFKWAEQYHQNFAGPRGGFFGNIMENNRDFMDANGVFGKIIKIDGQTLTINDRNNVEKIVLATDKTIIVEQRRNIKLPELEKEDIVVVVGNANSNGQIEAELIRVMPPVPQNY